MDVAKEFTSDKLSQIMAQSTVETLDWPLNISSWRHINIAWKRKLCVASFEEDVPSTIHAMQSGHTKATENRIYGLSPEALLGAPEDLLQLFLQASTDWQKVIGVIPGGMLLKYSQARRHHFHQLVHDDRRQLATLPVPLAMHPSLHKLLADQEKLVQSVGTLHNENSTLLVEIRTQIAELRAELHHHPRPIFREPSQSQQNALVPQQPLQIPQSDHVLQASHLPKPAPETNSHAALLLLRGPASPLSSPALAPQQSQPAFTEDLISQLNPSTSARPLPSSPLLLSSARSGPSQSAVLNGATSSLSHPSPSVFLTDSPPPKALPEKDMLGYLRQMYGESADWREPAQYEAVKVLMALERDVIVALRTGAGKSAIALLPSFVEQGITVIIAPLISLQEDWVRRLDRLKIPYEQYQGTQGPPLRGTAKIILVSSDIAKTPAWDEQIALQSSTCSAV